MLVATAGLTVPTLDDVADAVITALLSLGIVPFRVPSGLMPSCSTGTPLIATIRSPGLSLMPLTSCPKTGNPKKTAIANHAIRERIRIPNLQKRV
jgi:hypothetical protein